MVKMARKLDYSESLKHFEARLQNLEANMALLTEKMKERVSLSLLV